jgi:hypothetical protein
MADTIKQRRGTAAQWTSANPILALGEVGWETDTRKGKLGNGIAAWNSLDYIAGAEGGGSGTITSVNGDDGPSVVLTAADVGAVATVNGDAGPNVVVTPNMIGAIETVNGESGPEVTLSAADVGALPTSYVPDFFDLTSVPASFPPDSHTHLASEVSDSTSLGRSLLSAVSQAAARSAIGAGTSSLVIGTLVTNAKAGNYTPTIADLPAGSTLTVKATAGVWPSRPTARTDIVVQWVDSVGSAIATPAGALAGDIVIQNAA